MHKLNYDRAEPKTFSVNRFNQSHRREKEGSTKPIINSNKFYTMAISGEGVLTQWITMPCV